MSRSFNAVAFSGGPLDGVCWPCILNPDKVVVTTHPDGQGKVRAYLYECDQETEGADGMSDYRMSLVPIDQDMIDEVVHDMQGGGGLIR